MKCIEDEIPFEVPEGWEWCRLGSITDNIQYGLSNSAEQAGAYRLLRITDIQNSKVNWDIVPFTQTKEAKKYMLHINDIVFARTGATVGKSFLVKELPYESVYASYLIRIRLTGDISSDYIYQFFNSQCYWKQITGKAVGVGQPNCNGTSLKELFIPLPPISEQIKIVPVANSFLKYVEHISDEKESLGQLINFAKSKILDLAIRGELVPRNPNDEPASVLLERIRAEKEELIKAGKIKRDKKESIIFRGEDNSYYESIKGKCICIDNDLPLNIPESWMWSKIDNIAFVTKLAGFEYTKNIAPNLCEKGIPLFKGKNVQDSTIIYEFEAFIPEEISDELSRSQITRKCILTPYVGTIGNIAIHNKPGKYHLGSNVGKIELYNKNTLLFEEYVVAYLQSSFGYQQLTKHMKATAQPSISIEAIRDVYIPIPPENEQQKIVLLLNTVVSKIDLIKNVLI